MAAQTRFKIDFTVGEKLYDNFSLMFMVLINPK